MSHDSSANRRWDLRPILQPATRGRLRCCGFTFVEQWCHPSLYTIFHLSRLHNRKYLHLKVTKMVHHYSWGSVRVRDISIPRKENIIHIEKIKHFLTWGSSTRNLHNPQRSSCQLLWHWADWRYLCDTVTRWDGGRREKEKGFIKTQRGMVTGLCYCPSEFWFLKNILTFDLSLKALTAKNKDEYGIKMLLIIWDLWAHY